VENLTAARALIHWIALILLASGTASAQGPLGERVSQCQPSHCDPLTANGGALKSEGPVTLIVYGHFRSLLQYASFDTQRPSTNARDLNEGSVTPTLVTKTQTPADVHFQNNRFSMMSTTGIETATLGPNDGVRAGALPYALQVAGETMYGYWYLSPNLMPNGLPGGPLPSVGVAPAVGVYMRLETGPHPGRGLVIAEGDTGLGAAQPDASRAGTAATLIQLPDGDYVYEFKVPMKVKARSVPPETGLILTAVHYQLSSDQASATQSGWRVRTGHQFPPHLAIDIMNPAQSLAAKAVTRRDGLEFRWDLTGAWGAFDMDWGSLKAEVTGPSTISESALEFNAQASVAPTGDAGPVNAVWRVDLKKTKLQDGEHTVKFSAQTLQGTYLLTANATFMVKDGRPLVEAIGKAETASTPAPGFALIVLAMVGALAAMRRRPQ
jgi:MYXO-CTERM domain-containing protein